MPWGLEALLPFTLPLLRRGTSGVVGWICQMPGCTYESTLLLAAPEEQQREQALAWRGGLFSPTG